MQNKPCVLVVEDNELNRKLATRILELAGFTTRLAGSGVECRALLGSEHFDLILMDIQLPDESGLELAREICRDRAHVSAIPVIVVSAQGRPEDRAVALEAGCASYVAKPFRMRELLSAVWAALNPSVLSAAP